MSIDVDGSVIVYSCLAEHVTKQRSAVKSVAEVLHLPL